MILKRLIVGVENSLSNLLARYEKNIIACPGPNYPPIFIVGAPRTGTTLIYQILVRSLGLGYFCNLAARFYRFPALTTKLVGSLVTIRHGETFVSNYGTSSGLLSVSQGNLIWARWFPVDQSYVDASYLSDRDLAEMRGTVAQVCSIFKMPFVNKVQGHAVRLSALHKVFPNLCLIRVRREEFYVAQSILLGRRKLFADDAHWFSAKTSDYEELKSLPPLQQIPCYLKSIEGDMDKAITEIGSNRVFDLSYEKFCNAPQSSVNNFIDFYEQLTGYKLERKTSPPDHFDIARKVRLAPEEEIELRRNIDELKAGK